MRTNAHTWTCLALPVRPASPLPPNVPTGPRNKNKYKDIDNTGPAVDGLDYGGGKERTTPPDYDDRGSRLVGCRKPPLFGTKSVETGNPEARQDSTVAEVQSGDSHMPRHSHLYVLVIPSYIPIFDVSCEGRSNHDNNLHSLLPKIDEDKTCGGTTEYAQEYHR